MRTGFLPILAALLFVLSCGSRQESRHEPSLVYVSGGSGRIQAYFYDQERGLLELASESDGGANPSYLAFSSDGRWLYAVNSGVGEGRVLSFRVDRKDGALTRVSGVPSGGKGPCHLSVHPGGRWLYVAHYGSGHVSVLPLGPDGSLGPPRESHVAGVKAHMAITDPEGRHLLVPTLGLDQVQVYRIDHRSGSLIRHDPPFFSLPEGAGPRHLAFSPDQKWLCVINELGWSLTRFRYDGDTGRADRPFSIAAMAGHVGQGSCAHVEVSRDGRFVYGSNRGHDSIVVCRAEAEGLVAIAHETAGGEIKVPRHFTLDPRGAYLLAASQGADYVTVLAVDPASGLLSKVHRVSCGDKPSFVGFLPPAPR